MAIAEEQRHKLHQRLDEVLGEEQATTLMEHLPPVGWADVATKRDLDVLRIELGNQLMTDFRAEFSTKSDLDAACDRLRHDLRGDIRSEFATKAELRAACDGLRHDLMAEIREEFPSKSEMRTDLASLRHELKGEMHLLRAEIADLRTELHKSLRQQTMSLFAAMVSFAGIVVAAAHIT